MCSARRRWIFRQKTAKNLAMKRLLPFVVLAACGTEPAPQTSLPALTISEFLGQSGLVRLRPHRPFRDDLKIHTWKDGQLTSRLANRRDQNCFFFGDVELQGLSHPAAVALRTCMEDGTPEVSGVAFHRDQMFEISQGQGGLKFTEVKGSEGACGVTDRPIVDAELPSPPTTRVQALSTGEPRFIELLVARDVQLQEAIASGEYVPDPVMTVHAAAALYDRTAFEDRVLPILTGILDAEGENPWGNTSVYFGEARTGQYLDGVNAWVSDNLAALPQFDQMTVLSGYDFFGSTVGLANVEGACDPDYSAVVVEGIGNDPSIAQTLAHELGHSLGMWHDGDSNICPSSGFVMTAIYDPDGPFATQFSDCSLVDGNAFLASASASCITFDSQPAHPAAYCGDGKIEGVEQCDCGPLGCEGRNPCCNDDCTLKAGATCSPDDPCCNPQTCAPLTESVVCRPAAGPCDLAESCSNGTCPPDEVVPTGQTCDQDGWSGACFLGACVTRGGTCEDLASGYILDSPPYDPSCADEGDCGPVPCLAENTCVVLEEFAPDGTVCGNSKQCFAGACQPSANLPGRDGCADPAGCPTPEQPVDPADPSDPTDPSAPADPMPTDPNQPVDPADPNAIDPGNTDTSNTISCSVGGFGPSTISLLLLALFRRR